ncbi:MAG: MATE family efflux transporter, partial [Betaproteobacteria bacterium]
RLSAPIFIAQVAVLANAVADTIIAGHYKADHLAAIGLGSAIWASVFIPVMGVLQGLSPIIGRHFGAGEPQSIGRQVRAGAWLASALAVPIVIAFAFPDPILRLAQIPENVRPLTRAYLQALACGVPALMLTRVFYAFAPAVGHPRAVMAINVAALALKIPLSYAFVHGAWGMPELGGPGCGVASAILYWLMLGLAIAALRYGDAYRRYQVWEGSWRFDRATVAGIVRLGGPIGASILIEVTSFTFMALFLARLGATVSGAQQIATNLAALLFMMPLSLGIGTQVLISQALGAKRPQAARSVAYDGLRLSIGCASVVCLSVWLARDTIIGLYTSDPGVARLASELFPLLVVFHWFDAIQCSATQSLRGYRQTLVPMLIYAVALWGIGLGVGYLLAFAPWPAHWLPTPLGAIGFWLAQAASLVVCAIALNWEFARISRVRSAAG